MNKKLTKAELKNIINKDWALRRQKLAVKKAKNNEYTKLWKEQERLVKFLESLRTGANVKISERVSQELDTINKHRRKTYITSPGPEGY